MSKYILGVDPGSLNTGWAKLEVQEGSVNRVVGIGVTAPPKAAPPLRIKAIIAQLMTVMDAKPAATEIWTELFVPYGARRGAMWNTTLVGALLYLPVTRMRENLECFGVHPSTWKSWFKKQLEPGEGIVNYCDRMGVTLNDGDEVRIAQSAHIADALGIALFSVYGVDDVEQVDHV